MARFGQRLPPPKKYGVTHWSSRLLGKHLTTEAFRRDLIKIGIKPYEARKAALSQLAGSAPAPVLAELLGLTDANAADWARLAARDWTNYIALRAQ